MGEVGIGEGGGAGQVGDSARTEGTTEREGTDGTTRVASRGRAPEDSRGEGLEAGQTRAARRRPRGDAHRTTIQRSLW
jgi:hypothetical protein